MFIYPYKVGSKSVKNLKEGAGYKIIRREGSKYKGGSHKVVLNWGNRTLPEEVLKSEVLNFPPAVALASDKLAFFNAAHETVQVPSFTTDKGLAHQWMADSGGTIVVRETLSGHSGEGIVLIDSENEWEEYDHSRAKMYVEYIPKKEEYRVHVMGGQVIDVQRKARRNDFPNNAVNWKIRNHSNGFVFAREGVSPDKDVLDQSLKAIDATGLDFGAVDVIWNAHRGKAYVLEINTAPGLEGSTVLNYIKGLDEMYEKARRKQPRRLNSSYTWNNFEASDLFEITPTTSAAVPS